MAAVCLLGLLAGLAGGPEAQTRPELGADPAMVKGAATPTVTIVEFSDYLGLPREAFARCLEERRIPSRPSGP